MRGQERLGAREQCAPVVGMSEKGSLIWCFFSVGTTACYYLASPGLRNRLKKYRLTSRSNVLFSARRL